MTNSQSIDPTIFNTERPEVFHMGLVRIDIQQAKRILASKRRRPRIYRCDLNPLRDVVQRPEMEQLDDGTLQFTTCPVSLDWDLIDSPHVDIDVPILLARLPERLRGIWPIDGWHRIAKAVDAGLNSLPCHILSTKDTSSIIQWPE